MKHLYAPWRSLYAASADATKKEGAHADECIFCAVLQEKNDEANLILHRYEHCFVMLNKYPYNASHLMVLPFAHTANLGDLRSEVRDQLMELTSKSVDILTEVYAPEGFNIGMNIGKAAGAGIPSHMHMHVLPRWRGDTNFLPTLASTKAISFDLTAIYTQLKPHFQQVHKQ